MTTPSRPGANLSAMYLAEYRRGAIGRREFLTRATMAGLGAGVALRLSGAAPARAETGTAGHGTLRIQMEVRPLTDPRLWDWPQMANVARGWLEWLVQHQPDGTLRGMLLERWEMNEDATQYVLHLRRGVTWNNGDPFVASDVAANIRRWCARDVRGNSMAGRMSGLIDPATGILRKGVLEIIDDVTLRLSLPAPDVAFVANLSDYPAAIVHPSYDGGDFSGAQIGTGPYLLEDHEVNARAVLRRNPDHRWWAEGLGTFGQARLDRIEYLDLGTDPASWVAALEDGAVDMLYESVGEFVEVLDDMGFIRSETPSANTICIRANQSAEIDGRRPYADLRVRRALQLAVRNDVLLSLGYSNLGIVAGNHHVCPIHPDYAEIPPPRHDPAEALRLLDEAGMRDFEHELVSIDDEWRRATADAAAAQLRDAGITVRRRILPGTEFWSGWQSYPFSTTNWYHRPLGVQVLALAYRSGAAWNETGYASDTFDTVLAEALTIAPADRRRAVMGRLEEQLRADGVIIQPYWRAAIRHFRPRVTGAAMHPAYEIRPAELGLGNTE